MKTTTDPELWRTGLEEARDRLVVALDFPAAEPAIALAERLREHCRWVKIGLELFCATGPGVIETMRGLGYEVFLDLKLHDIPNTVAAAVRSVARSGASLLTVHAGGGEGMLQAAREAAEGVAGGPRLLGVTVLTSLSREQLQGVGVEAPVAAQVLRLARLAQASGLDGMVCSPLEAQLLRLELGADPELVVPGIRSAGVDRGDQVRTATAADAIASGASRLVVGRPITRAADPVSAAEGLLREIAAALVADAPLFE